MHMLLVVLSDGKMEINFRKIRQKKDRVNRSEVGKMHAVYSKFEGVGLGWKLNKFSSSYIF